MNIILIMVLSILLLGFILLIISVFILGKMLKAVEIFYDEIEKLNE